MAHRLVIEDGSCCLLEAGGRKPERHSTELETSLEFSRQNVTAAVTKTLDEVYA